MYKRQLFGREVNGAKAWFEFGSLRVQPVEFAKIATALALARVMSEYSFSIHRAGDLMTVAVVICIPLFIIILQNDTCLLYTSKGKTSGSLFAPALRMVICIPSGATNVEIRAVRDSAEHAGGREVYMIYEPMAAALDVYKRQYLIRLYPSSISSTEGKCILFF